MEAIRLRLELLVMIVPSVSDSWLAARVLENDRQLAVVLVATLLRRRLQVVPALLLLFVLEISMILMVVMWNPCHSSYLPWWHYS